MEASEVDRSPKKGDPVLTPSQTDLQACLVTAFRRDVSGQTIRWEGQHAAFPPEMSVSASAVDEIKIYWPLLTEFVRSSAYGLQREMCLQELESGPLLKIPVGEYPDLNNVKQHSTLVRTRSASMKALFGFSTKADAGDDDGESPEGGFRGRSPSGKVMRRISIPAPLPSGSSPRTSEGGSPSSTALRKALARSPSDSSGSAATSPDGSPSAPSQPQPQQQPPAQTSFASSLSSKLRGAGAGSRNSTKYTQSYLSFRRRILVESVSPQFFRDLTRSFDERASYLQDQPGTLLPRVIGMLRLSQQPAGQSAKQKRKAYFVLSTLPFPMENHSQIFSLCLRGSGGAGGGAEGSASGGDRVGVGPYSEGIFLSDGDVCREHELLVDSYTRVELAAQLASDLGHLQRQGRTHFAVLCVATCRDPVLGALYTPGAALGPESTANAALPLCDRPDLPARHDLPRGVTSAPQALLPVPTCSNVERPQWEYYLSVHESTDGAAGSSWTGWFTGRVGVHEQTSRLLKFLKERLLIDGGDGE